MTYLFALAIFMIVVATRRKLASLPPGGGAGRSRRPLDAHAWTALGGVMAVACLLCLVSPTLGDLQIAVGENALPLWMLPFTGVFAWFLLALVTNRW